MLLAVAAALVFGPPLVAESASYRRPLHRRIIGAFLPKPTHGYIPAVGSPALRFSEAPPPAPIVPPPVVLYAPPPPAAPKSAQTEVAAIATPPPMAQPAPDVPGQPAQLRPEDFLPFFQLDDGSAKRATPEGLQFTPARPSLPTSRAEYRQQ